MWPGGQVWKPGLTCPATAAAWPPRGGFGSGFSVAGVAEPLAMWSSPQKSEDLKNAGQSRTEAEPRDPSVRDDRSEAEARGGAVALGL